MSNLFIETIYAFIGSLGFGIIFNIRGKNLFAASIGGAIGWFVYKFPLLLGAHSTTNTIFLASVVISIYAEIMARILKQPVTIFAIAALIPLVPGSGMYYTTFEAVRGNMSQSASYGIKTLYDAGAIAVGLILVSTIARILKQKKFLKIKEHYKLNKKTKK